MWKPSQLGEVVAERRLVARGRNGRRRTLVVRFGRPVHSTVKNDPWWCPVEIADIGQPRLLAAAGEDSVQALILALRLADIELGSRSGKAQVEWLGDAERPIFFHTHLIDMYQGAIDNLLAALRKAIAVIESPRNVREWKQSIVELRHIEAGRGFAGASRGPKRRK